MPVFTINLLKQQPLASLGLCLLLGGFFIACLFSDNSKVSPSAKLYQESGISSLEQSFYLNYQERRLRIEQQGSEETFDKINQAFQEKTKIDLSWVILNDRAFYRYLLNDGPLFLDPPTYRNWREIREQTIQPQLGSFSINRFGFTPETPTASTFLSYAFVDTELLRLLLNILAILLLAPFLESTYSPARLAQGFLFSALISSLSYTFIASEQNPILLGASGATAGMLGMVFAVLFRERVREPRDASNSVRDLYQIYLSAFVLVFFFIGKVSLEAWFGSTDSTMAISYMIAFFLAIPFDILIATATKEQLKTQELKKAEQDNWPYRVELANAYETLTRFEFEKTKAQLTQILDNYPNDKNALKQLYLLEKLNPKKASYRVALEQLIDACTRSNDLELTYGLLKDIKHNWSSKRELKESLSPDSYHKIMMIFIQGDQLKLAEQAFHYLELAGSPHIVQDACRVMSDEYKKRLNNTKSQEYAMLLDTI